MPIVIKDLSYSYSDGPALRQAALTNVSLTITEGEILGVIGHTGSGKTTLMQHLNGLIPAQSGTVTVDGYALSDKKQRIKARSLVGMVFQYPEYQLFADTVESDVAFGPRNLKLDEEEIKSRVLSSLELVGLSPALFLKKSPFELSGGEKRRAALAGILAMQPKYLVLDEPMAGLDPRGRRDILSILENLRRERGCTIVMVSHSMDDVARHATRIAVLDHGKLLYTGSPAEVFSNSKELSAIGLALPQACKLALLLRQRGKDVPASVCTAEDMRDFLLGRLTHE